MSLVRELELTTCKAILERIKARAIARWSEERWQSNLVREYCNIALENGEENATPVNRRGQIVRAFEVGSCSVDTLIMLAASVGCRFQMVCVIEQIEEL